MLLLQIIFSYFINIVLNVLFYIFSVHCSHLNLFYLFINKGKLHKTNLQFTLSRWFFNFSFLIHLEQNIRLSCKILCCVLRQQDPRLGESSGYWHHLISLLNALVTLSCSNNLLLFFAPVLQAQFKLLFMTIALYLESTVLDSYEHYL